MSSDFDRIAGHMGTTRTEFQVKAHHGFAPQAIRPRQDRITSTSDGPPSAFFATPPSWTNDGYMPCVPPAHFSLTAKIEHWAQWDDVTTKTDAAALCEGCPVLHECRAEAMAQEVWSESANGKAGEPLSAPHRYTVRGGWTPTERAAHATVGLVAVVDACPRGHEWTEENTYIHTTSGERKCRACGRDYRKAQGKLHFTCACGKQIKKTSKFTHLRRFECDKQRAA